MSVRRGYSDLQIHLYKYLKLRIISSFKKIHTFAFRLYCRTRKAFRQSRILAGATKMNKTTLWITLQISFIIGHFIRHPGYVHHRRANKSISTDLVEFATAAEVIEKK